MSSYRSAYENYYKNINKLAKGSKDNNRSFAFGKKADNSNSLKYGMNTSNNDTIRNTFIKRITRELTGATILVLFFALLKYTPVTEFNDMYIKCKQTLEQNFNYNESIEAFNSTPIGNIQGRDLKIGNFTTEDLKIENLKMSVENFIEYLKNSSNSEN